MNTLYAHPSLSHRARAYMTIAVISFLLLALFASILPELKPAKIPLLFLYFSPILIPLLYFFNQAKTNYFLTETGVERRSLVRTKHVSWDDIGEVQSKTVDKNDMYKIKSGFALGPIFALINLVWVLAKKTKKKDQVTVARLLNKEGRLLLFIPRYLTPDFAKLVVSRAQSRDIPISEL